MILAVAVGLAAAVGAVARYLLDQWVQDRHDSVLPWGTYLVNMTGSFVLGLVTGLAVHQGLPAVPTTVLGVGFAGGYTTWSTWSWESLRLAEDGALIEATLNAVGSVATGLLAAGVGLGLALL